MALLMRDQENIDKRREQGEGRFAELTQKLLRDKRYMDLEKAQLTRNTVGNYMRSTIFCEDLFVFIKISLSDCI